MLAIFTKEFWEFAGERAIKTAAQAAVSVIGVDAIGILNVDWADIASISAGAAAVSILTALASDWQVGAAAKTFATEVKQVTAESLKEGAESVITEEFVEVEPVVEVEPDTYAYEPRHMKD